MTWSFGSHYVGCMSEGRLPGPSGSTKHLSHQSDEPFLNPCFGQGHDLATLGFQKLHLSKTTDIRSQERTELSPS